MIKVLINGCNGKMGQEVAKAIERNDNFQTVCGVDRLDTGDNNFPVYTDTSKISEEPDVIVDFSTPVATFNILKYAQTKKIPVVIATKGFTDVLGLNVDVAAAETVAKQSTLEYPSKLLFKPTKPPE